MKIAVSSVGSEGDIRPYVALAKGLQEAGHEVFLLAADLFAERARTAGVPWRSNGVSATPEKYREQMATLMQQKNPLQQIRTVFSMVEADLCASVPHVFAALKEVDAVVYHHIDVVSFAAAEAHGIPRFPGVLFHTALPMKGSNWNGKNLGSWLNRLSSGILRAIFRKATDEALGRVLKAAGAPPRKGVILEATESPWRALIAISPRMVPTDPLWEGRYVQTGYWFLDEPDFAPPPELEKFLSEGEPPIVVTFGSMIGTDARAYTAAVLEGIKKTGRRAILQAGWGGMGEGELPSGMLRVGYVPHGWLFSRAACVMHHGGAGTTAAVLRAGVPQVIVWHMGDQPAWGEIVYRRGVGAKPIPHYRLSPDRVAKALTEALSPETCARAREMGEHIRAEDGVKNAVRVIEEALQSREGGKGSGT